MLGLPFGDLGRLFSFLLQVLKTRCVVCLHCSSSCSEVLSCLIYSWYLALYFLLSPRFGKVSVAFFKVCYLLPLNRSSLVLHGQSRYMFWGDYQNLATPAMSQGIRHPRQRGKPHLFVVNINGRERGLIF